jgi:YD repeat-containing protein
LLLTISSVVTVPPVWADDGVDSWVEFRKHVDSAEHIAALEEGFAGDSVSLYDGATTFSVTDINVPGNSSLPVQLIRRISIEMQVQGVNGDYDTRLLGAGNWDVDVPYITATYQSPNAYPSSPGWQAQRCSVRSAPDFSLPPPFWDSDVWSGITIHIPGRGNTKALAVNASVLMPSSGGPYRLTTSARDAIDCIPMKLSGFAGEGFKLTTTAGIQYYFDYGVTRVASTLRKWWSDGRQTRYLPRYQYYILASKIQDRYGNWVQFQYNSAGHPTRIWSSDEGNFNGREIDLTYDGDRLESATTDGHAWHYDYDSAGNLKSVTLPDNSHWQYTYIGSLRPPMPPPGESFINNRCQIPPALIDDDYTLTATSPSGAKASFLFQNTRHYRSGVIVNECINIGESIGAVWYLRTPYFFDVMSLTQKTISGSGIPTASWGYDYDAMPSPLWGTVNGYNPYPCTTCRLDKTNIVLEPDGTRRLYRFGVEYALNDGRQFETDTVLADGSTVFRSKVDDYLAESAVSSQPFYPQYGDVLDGVGDPASAFIRPIVQSQISQDDATFTTATNNFDLFARPLTQTESSSLGSPPFSRAIQTAYHDDMDLWVLGQVAKSTVAGIVVAETSTYNSKAQPLIEKQFDKVVSTKAWRTTDGTLQSIKDGNGKTTTFSDWKRGLPQTVQFPDETQESAVVNDSGWITSLTDENGFTTGYQYDPMGRLAVITYPLGDDKAWNKTYLSFTPAGTGIYNTPVGAWVQTVQAGNGITNTYFDAL